MAVGAVPVTFGKEVSWDQLVEASRARQRRVRLPLAVGEPTERVKFPPTPSAEPREEETRAAEQAFGALLAERLARSPGKDVYVYVHGFDNTFDDSVKTIAQLWHFLGRQGVAIAYSWPAGGRGLLGYGYDRESGEFTVYHLKQMLRLLGQAPDVAHVHIIAHSRGTDVALVALRELCLEERGNIAAARRALKLGTLLLAAPDIDMDVALQRLAAERLFELAETTVIYVSEGDWALWLANWIFLGVTRFGKLQPGDLSPEELEILQSSKRLQVVDAYNASVGLLGHSYFYESPAVSSDVILVLRDGREPGAEHGRPLVQESPGFWRMDQDYPRVCPEPKAEK